MAGTEQRLDSWKEIGHYFGRDERTVKRWERERGLPVHRVPGSGRGRVYAYPHELADWLQNTKESLAGEYPPANGVHRPAFTAVEIAGLRNPALAGKPPEPSYTPVGFRPSSDSSARLPESAPRLSLVHRAAPADGSRGQASADLPPAIPVPLDATPRAPIDHRRAAWWIGGLALLIVLAGAGAWWTHRAALHRAQATTETAANSQAQNLYLQGRYFWQQRTPESLTKAVDLFTQAIVHDPNYAPAYAGLAECYELLREFSTMPDAEAFPRALSAAQQAVKLNPNLAQAHAALGFAQFYWTWDTTGALKEYQRALQLDPGSAQTHHWYATSLMSLGRSQQALDEINRAQQLDPGSRAILADKGVILLTAGHSAEARTLLQQVEQSDPDFVSPHRYLANIALHQGDGDDFVRETRQVATLLHDPEGAQVAALAETAYRAGGPTAMTKALNDHTRDLYRQGKLGPVDMAPVELSEGNLDAAFKLLDLGYARRDPGLRTLVLDPMWTPYRADPRFTAIENRLGVAVNELRAE
jgi:tetratricopeptide (TPR) repeat protein